VSARAKTGTLTSCRAGSASGSLALGSSTSITYLYSSATLSVKIGWQLIATNPAMLYSIGYETNLESPEWVRLYLKKDFLNLSTITILTLVQLKIKLRCRSHSSVNVCIDLVLMISSMN